MRGRSGRSTASPVASTASWLGLAHFAIWVDPWAYFPISSWKSERRGNKNEKITEE